LGADRLSYGITGLDLTVYRRYVEGYTGENNPDGQRDHGARASHQYWTGRGFSTHNNASLQHVQGFSPARSREEAGAADAGVRGGKLLWIQWQARGPGSLLSASVG
jgi:hypothetical protein